MEPSFAVVEAGVFMQAQGIAQPVPWWSFNARTRPVNRFLFEEDTPGVRPEG